MSIACPSIIGLDKDEKFQEFKSPIPLKIKGSP